MSDIVKICPKHGKLTISQIVIHAKTTTKTFYRCRQCNKDRCLKWKRAHPNAWNERYQREKHSEKYQRQNRNTSLKRKFKITIDDYERILKEQNGVCAICFRTEEWITPTTKRKRYLAVDHCHKTGNIRGLLCSSCNTAYGLLEENILLMQKMIEYKKSRG